MDVDTVTCPTNNVNSGTCLTVTHTQLSFTIQRLYWSKNELIFPFLITCANAVCSLRLFSVQFYTKYPVLNIYFFIVLVLNLCS